MNYHSTSTRQQNRRQVAGTTMSALQPELRLGDKITTTTTTTARSRESRTLVESACASCGEEGEMGARRQRRRSRPSRMLLFSCAQKLLLLSCCCIILTSHPASAGQSARTTTDNNQTEAASGAATTTQPASNLQVSAALRNNSNGNSDNNNNRSPVMMMTMPPLLLNAAKAEALTSSVMQQQQPQSAPLVASSKLFEICKLQSRMGLQFTNLSQIMFHPIDVCSSWYKMQRSPLPSAQDAAATSTTDDSSYPWFYIEKLDVSHNNLTVLHDSSGMSRLINLLELRITHNQLARCEESSLAGLQRLQQLDLSHNRLMALPTKFFQPVKHTIKKLNLSFNSISVLVPTLFDSLSQLEYLDLSHNDITSHWINDRLFKNLTQLHYLDLSFNKLTVFNSPMTFSSLLQLQTLSLQHNELRQVPDTIQHLRYLSSLDLSQNYISDITNASYLSNCRLLFDLNLESNLLENITRDAFSDLPALKVLNLANNKIHHLDQQAFDYVLDLHMLRMDSNRLIDFGQAFVNLRFLLMLNISSNRISSFDYAQIPLGLQWLDLHSNRIDKLNNFYYSPTAQQQFSTNDINQQSGAGSSIGQQWQSMLRLTTLDVSFNLIKELDNTSLPESLETVQLNNNHIRSIASHTFSTKSNLTRINLSHNQISTMPFDSLKLHGNRDNNNAAQQQSVIFTNGQKFVDIYLANNPYVCNCNMGWLSQLLLASSTLLQGSNLSASTMLREHQLILNRQLPRVADAHLINCHLPFARQSPFTKDPHHWSPVMAANQLAVQQSHHHHNTNQQQQHQALIHRQSELLASVHLCPYKSHCFALCYCCDFDACDCEMSCPENCSCYYAQTWSTNIVDCSANNQINANSQSRQMSSIPGGHRQPAMQQQFKFTSIPDKIPMDVTELYLDGLTLNHLRGNALIGRRNLKSLYLNNSQVTTIEPKAFATQKSLRILQLNSNYLKELHGYEFEQQVELRELYLANNQLTSIANMTFAPLISLQILHLQNNQLYHLNFWSNLPIGNKLLSLNLGSNPWSCQCDHIDPMLQWLNAHTKLIHDRKSVSCQYNKTNSLHLLPPSTNLLTSSSSASAMVVDGELETSTTYGSLLDENYPMFDLRMCLNYTVYPIIPSPASSSPSPQQQQFYENDNENRQLENSSPTTPRNREPINVEADQMIPGISNDDPYMSPRPMYGSPMQQPAFGVSSFDQGGGVNPPSVGTYILPQPNAKSGNIFSSSFMLGMTTMAFILIVLVLSLIHYRRRMSVWFYSRYGLNMFSATKSHTHNHAIGSLAKHSQLHHHHHPQHPQQRNLHHHQCGISSTGSTNSSSAASSNLSQALCQQQSSTAASSGGLVTTPLIVTNSHQLLNSAATTTTTTTTATSSPYNEDEKLFDAYLTYSKFDEQFINEFIAPELEYGQPAYRIALHYRDVPATAAKFLPDCIIETANASRRVIMILSEQLLKTEWTQFEFRTAHLEALRNNYRHRLIVIMLGQPSLAQLDPEIVQWLKNCTCIQWGDKMFWQRLRFAMPELPFNRQQPQYLRYQTMAPHQTSGGNNGKQKQTLGANLLKSAGGLLGGGGGNSQPQQQLVTTANSMQHHHQSLGRPLPQPSAEMRAAARQQEEHHYAHLTPSTMIYNQQSHPQQHTYHQPIYGDPQQQQQQQQQQRLAQQQCPGRDNPTVPVHI